MNFESASWALGRLVDRLYKFLHSKSAAICESVTLTTARVANPGVLSNWMTKIAAEIAPLVKERLSLIMGWLISANYIR
ncbi:MAG: hypothetical protein EAZ90_06405 [Oscillatoriales cyanobacterium]|nr:MAG: hypothetical protein EAZ93_04040 [Oscillatoriales cyanobacterium]TAE44507.1 MAG: hypothetical protein EAZ90_06405 [Oscillatoriales cyanobacterium]TAF91817.1 MAG: hypothetical protein EAZ49_04745 [Oscillatoriales cyanobacterium]TAG06372.1 MAG: hypothetical protein EAZ45_04870 [Oscillatoriales cyanobacterium]TAG43129.1 MAG: hypothetical protein EAZ33_13495 [Oscillatoriales cyanobacterium]